MGRNLLPRLIPVVGIAVIVLLAGGGGAFSSAAGRKRFVEIVIEVDGAAFRLGSAKATDRPRGLANLGFFRQGSYYLEFLDAAGAVRHVRSVPDPALVFVDSVGPGTSGGKELRSRRVRLGRSRMTVNLPWDRNVKALRISLQRRSAPGGHGFPRRDDPLPSPEDLDLERKETLRLDGLWD